MKVLLTVGFEGEREAFVEAMSAEVTKLLASGGAGHGAVNVRVEGDELDGLKVLDTEQDARAVVTLSEPPSPAAALGLALPASSHLVGAYLVEEVVQRDYERTWPAGTASPGVNLFKEAAGFYGLGYTVESQKQLDVPAYQGPVGLVYATPKVK